MMANFKIIEAVPGSWVELQEFVARILNECGFETEIEKTIETVRGKVEIDVYAEKIAGFQAKVLCECKYWEGNIPQTVIHAFRTVVGDYGASQGFIISKKGFQKGAYEAIAKSNVSILNWNDFQETFKLEWLGKVMERNYKIGRELMKLSQEIAAEIHKGTLTLSDKELNVFYEQKESDFLFFTFKEHFLELETYEISYVQIDSSINSHQKRLPGNIVCYSDYFNCIYAGCKQIIDDWKRLLSKAKGL